MSAASDRCIPGWRAKAACLGEDPELFFPIGVTGSALDQAERAKRVCERCAVRAQCLDWALGTHQDAGIWGATTEDERRTLRRSRARRPKPRPTLPGAK